MECSKRRDTLVGLPIHIWYSVEFSTLTSSRRIELWARHARLLQEGKTGIVEELIDALVRCEPVAAEEELSSPTNVLSIVVCRFQCHLEHACLLDSQGTHGPISERTSGADRSE